MLTYNTHTTLRIRGTSSGRSLEFPSCFNVLPQHYYHGGLWEYGTQNERRQNTNHGLCLIWYTFVHTVLYGNLITKIFLSVDTLNLQNMGKILAGSFKWIYRRIYECSTERDETSSRKKIIVPSTACLWVIFAYILTGLFFGSIYIVNH